MTRQLKLQPLIMDQIFFKHIGLNLNIINFLLLKKKYFSRYCFAMFSRYFEMFVSRGKTS